MSSMRPNGVRLPAPPLHTLAYPASPQTPGSSTMERPRAVEHQVTAYAFVPSWTEARVTALDVYSGATVGSILITGEPYDIAVTPDGRFAYLSRRGANRVTVIDIGTMGLVATIPVGLEPHAVAVSADGSRVYVTEIRSHSISVIDTATYDVTSFFAGRMPWGIALTAEGDKALVVNRGSGALWAIDLAAHIANAVVVDREPVEVAIAPDGQTAYVTSTIDNTVVPIAMPSLEVQRSIPVGLFPRGLAITPDSREVFVANSNDDSITVIDAARRTVTGSIDMDTNAIPTGVAITPDGKRLLVGTHAGYVRIIDVATRQHIMRIYVGGQALRVSVGAMMIVPGGTSGAPLWISEDEDFTALGFGRFITFNGGVLQATGDWSTRRRVSLLAAGGAIDTQRFHVDLAGGVINDGPLIKHGRGTLTLSGLNTHPSTRVEEGTLIVTGSHAGRIVIGAAGILAGTGSVGAIDAPTGMISPGDALCPSSRVPAANGLAENPADSLADEGGAMLRATNVTMGPAHALVIDVGADGRASAACDCLAACGTAVLGGARLVLRQRGAVPRGAELVIVTNAAGSFAGIAEGATLSTAFSRFHLTYRGGHSGRDVVLTAR